MSSSTMHEMIARVALDHYSSFLPRKGKPSQSEWTVYAAILATFRMSDDDSTAVRVISSATGSKCTTVNGIKIFKKIEIPGCARSLSSEDEISRSSESKCSCFCQNQAKALILRDSHAEILARRGLVRALWKEIYSDCRIRKKESMTFRQLSHQSLLERVQPTQSTMSGTIQYRLRKGVELHLYISDSPCGDASIYDFKPQYNTAINSSNFTGAKILIRDDLQLETSLGNLTRCENSGNLSVESTSQSNVTIAREKQQVKCALRLKSGRSDIPIHLRSTSMSCSDKICKWIILGLQGCGLLSSLIESPILLSSILVSKDERSDPSHQLNALKRALVDRAQESQRSLRANEKMRLPDVHLVSLQFSRGKALTEKLTSDSESQICTAGMDVPSKKQKLDHPNDKSSNCLNKISRSPIGISINWQYDSDHESTHACERHDSNRNVELIIGAKGMKQIGNPKSVEGLIKCSSRLSSYSMFLLGLECLESTLKPYDYNQNNFRKPSNTTDIINKCRSGNISYQEAKRILGDAHLSSIKSHIFKTGPLMGWICDPNDFHLCHSTWQIDENK